MTLYKKKPIIIEAEQYQLGMEDGFNENGKPVIHTLEGDYIISDGDMIIVGIKGERYPCKNDIFELTYEKVE